MNNIEISKQLDNYQILRWTIQGYVLGFFIFIGYLELSPKLGNIWFRINDQGKYRINLPSLFNYIKYPFTNSISWKPTNWDLNFITFSTIISIIYTTYNWYNMYEN